MKLYAPVSIVNDFEGFDNVLFRWLVGHRPHPHPPLPYDQIIEGYDPNQEITGEEDVTFYVRELFTQYEVDMLQEYLLQPSGYVTDGTILVPKYVPLPVPNKPHWRYTAQAFGGGVHLLEIYARPNYNLPFEVEVFYDRWDGGHCIERSKKD